MVRAQHVLAGVAGLAAAFVLFVAISLVAPEEDLRSGAGEVVWQRFQFQEEHYSFTRGSVAQLVNADPVDLHLVLVAPSGGNSSFVVPVDAQAEVDLAQEGVYRLHAVSYPWADVQVEVRSSNPLVRLLEDMF